MKFFAVAKLDDGVVTVSLRAQDTYHEDRTSVVTVDLDDPKDAALKAIGKHLADLITANKSRLERRMRVAAAEAVVVADKRGELGDE